MRRSRENSSFYVIHPWLLVLSVWRQPTIIIIMIICRLHPSADRIRMHKNRLRINDLSSSDNGVFDCRAQNLAGAVNSSNSFLLSVPGTTLITTTTTTTTTTTRSLMCHMSATTDESQARKYYHYLLSHPFWT